MRLSFDGMLDMVIFFLFFCFVSGIVVITPCSSCDSDVYAGWL